MSRVADHRRSRLATAASTTAGAVLTVLLTAGPVLADNNPIGPAEGEDPGKGLSLAEALGFFVLVPLIGLSIIAVIVLLPGVVKAGRYRPGRRWNAAPVWFAGPPAPAAAVQDAQVGDVPRGGASGSW